MEQRCERAENEDIVSKSNALTWMVVEKFESRFPISKIFVESMWAPTFDLLVV